MRLEVLAAVVMKNEVFWDIMQCRGEQLLAMSRSTAAGIV